MSDKPTLRGCLVAVLVGTRREDGGVQLSVGAGQKYVLPVGRTRRFWARPGGQAGVSRTRGTKWGMKNAILGRCAPHDYGLRFT